MTSDTLSDHALLQCAKEMLVAGGMLGRAEAETLVTEENCHKIASDGSTRRFWRLARQDDRFCLIAAPAGTSAVELAESRSAWHIGRHLFRQGVPVPEIYGWDTTTGVLLFEDLGDTRLHDIIAEQQHGVAFVDNRSRRCYQEALEQLAAMQYRGGIGFDPAWCWDTPRYDTRLMVEKESGYFLRAFWQGLLGNAVDVGVVEELQEIARRAGEAPAEFFLHRDFQSRNIMVQDGAVRFIDFQGGRLGPLGYDLASLLIDPYAALPSAVQDELVTWYHKAISRYLPIDATQFNSQYNLLALQRNMQIVGAFSFLYKVRRKPFFVDFIAPSLISLSNRLENSLFEDFPLFRTLVTKGMKALKPTQGPPSPGSQSSMGPMATR